MTDKIKAFFSREDRGKFWLHIVFVAFGFWALSGIISLFKPQGGFYAFNQVLGGTSSCTILAAAILSIIERRQGREQLSKKQYSGENAVLIIFFALVVLAEVIAVYSGRVSYGVPLTLSGLAVFMSLRIAGPTFSAKQKLNSKAIMKILFLGTAASVVFGRFFGMFFEVLKSAAG